MISFTENYRLQKVLSCQYYPTCHLVTGLSSRTESKGKIKIKSTTNYLTIHYLTSKTFFMLNGYKTCVITSYIQFVYYLHSLILFTWMVVDTFRLCWWICFFHEISTRLLGPPHDSVVNVKYLQ